MNIPLLAFCLNLALAWYMTGVVLLVHRVQYPHLALLPTEIAPECHRRHMKDITPVVAPAMILELASSVLLLFARPLWLTPTVAWWTLALTLAVWAITFVVIVPLHNRLSSQWSPAVARRMTLFNWSRAAAWLARAILLSTILYQRLNSGP